MASALIIGGFFGVQAIFGFRIKDLIRSDITDQAKVGTKSEGTCAVIGTNCLGILALIGRFYGKTPRRMRNGGGVSLREERTRDFETEKMGPTFGSSKFAIVITELVNNKNVVLYA